MASEKSKGKKEEKVKASKRQNSISTAKNIINDPKPLVLPLVAVFVIAAMFYYIYSTQITTPFPTFLANFRVASRIAVAEVYGNDTQYAYTNPCAVNLIQMIAHSRNASTMDFFIMNKTTCYYSASGLGHTLSNVSMVSASKCMKYALSEPSIFLNYSMANSTYTTPYHLYVAGNANYMAKCGIAVDMAS